jgi:hypothetical protein
MILHPSTGLNELAWLPAQPPLQTPAAVAANVPPLGQDVSLVLTAPDQEATVVVRTISGKTVSVSVPAGRTRQVDLRALLHAGAGGPGPLLLTPQGGGPVYAVRVLHALGAHGPLVAVEAPSVLPLPIRLPPVQADLRAATP